MEHAGIEQAGIIDKRYIKWPTLIDPCVRIAVFDKSGCYVGSGKYPKEIINLQERTKDN